MTLNLRLNCYSKKISQLCPVRHMERSTRGTVRIGVGKEDEIDILRAIDDIKIFCESF